MGDTGEEYENGTYYTCFYSGHFVNLVSINEHTYKMTLADISYEENTDTIEINDNTRYIYTESYCLGGTDAYTIYLPGTPVEEIPAEAYSWLVTMNESEDKLTMIAIVDEENGYGMYSVDRPTPLEDAQMTFSTYKQAYDYYKEKLAEAETTADMVTYIATMYEVSDECLNYIWNLIRYNTDETKYREILVEQRKWISEKEAKALEVSSEYEGGSFAAISYNDTLATLTIERCEKLIGYLR